LTIGQIVAEIRRFSDFHNGSRPPCWIFKIQNFNGLWGSEVNMRHCVKFGDFIKPLPRYGDFPIFKLADVRHLGVLKFEFLTVDASR